MTAQFLFVMVVVVATIITTTTTTTLAFTIAPKTAAVGNKFLSTPEPLQRPTTSITTNNQFHHDLLLRPFSNRCANTIVYADATATADTSSTTATKETFEFTVRPQCP